VPAASYSSATDIKAALPVLKEKHLKRIAEEPEFQYLAADIVQYKKEQDEKTISLNEKERIAKKDAQTAKDLARVNERLLRLKLPQVKKIDDVPEKLEKLDPFLEETALITADLVMTGRIAKK
jgi:carboxyl-terminal processing protease